MCVYVCVRVCVCVVKCGVAGFVGGSGFGRQWHWLEGRAVKRGVEEFSFNPTS